MWSGHSCPLAVSMLLASGQECPLHTSRLLYFDNSTGIGELLLDGLRFFLGDALFHVLRGSIHQFLGFFQAQAGDFADGLDYIDLISADFFQDDGELGLLFRRSRCRRAATSSDNPTIDSSNCARSAMLSLQ